MIKPIRNALRKRGWIKASDMGRIAKESAAAKIDAFRKTKALQRISDKAYEGWTLTSDERFRELSSMALNALNLRGKE